jgi:uncharacterized membrane protein
MLILIAANDSRLNGKTSGDRSADSFRLDRAFALIAIIFGTILVLLIPPFQSADEPAHFYRAYQISEGTLIARQHDSRGIRGAYLPASLYNIWLPFSGIGFHPSHKASVSAIRDTMKIPLDAGDRIFIAIGNTAPYCPTCYLPQALGIGLGRFFGVPPLAMLYFGREANLLVWALLGTISLRIAPAIARPIFLLLLMPMSLWTAATVSADVPTNALAILFTAWIVARVNPSAKPIGLRSFVLLLAIAIPLTLCKLVYAPLLGLLLLIPKSRFVKDRRFLTLWVVLLISATALIFWASTSDGLETRINISSRVSPRAQMHLLEKNPSNLPGLLSQTIKQRGWNYAAGFVGLIGWSDLYLPAGVVIGYLILLLLACLSTGRDAHLPSPALTIVVVIPVVALSTVLIALLDYLFWSPVGYPVIDGISGRYFIPLAPAILLLLSSVAPGLPKMRRTNLITAAIAVCMCVYFVAIVWGRYYGSMAL